MAISKWVGGVIILVAFIFAGRSSQALEVTELVTVEPLQSKHLSVEARF